MAIIAKDRISCNVSSYTNNYVLYILNSSGYDIIYQEKKATIPDYILSEWDIYSLQVHLTKGNAV